MAIQERRKFPRLDTTKIEVMWRKEGTLDNIDHIRNLGAGGVRLVLDEDAVSSGDILQLEFILPGGQTIAAKGQVVWVSDFQLLGPEEKRSREAGIVFLDISKTDAYLIKQYVFSLLPPQK